MAIASYSCICPYNTRYDWLSFGVLIGNITREATSSYNSCLNGVVYSCQALVDAPDMVRGQMNFKRLSLTDIKIDIPRIPKKKSLIAAMQAAGEVVYYRFILPGMSCFLTLV